MTRAISSSEAKEDHVANLKFSMGGQAGDDGQFQESNTRISSNENLGGDKRRKGDRNAFTDFIIAVVHLRSTKEFRVTYHHPTLRRKRRNFNTMEYYDFNIGIFRFYEFPLVRIFVHISKEIDILRPRLTVICEILANNSRDEDRLAFFWSGSLQIFVAAFKGRLGPRYL
ncbi:hypothetical protein WA026_001397 [Henosepilachna vigintioctopunctata]|uniref:Uncharacterized protein n=1 Tax=Henosepilachna vigintioctopunctata TaxID=420089 RepID=A0AAW1UTB7_9CUCU